MFRVTSHECVCMCICLCICMCVCLYLSLFDISVFITLYVIQYLEYDRLDEDMSERMSALRRPNESEMDYYERRYQERVGVSYLLLALCYRSNGDIKRGWVCLIYYWLSVTIATEISREGGCVLLTIGSLLP